MNNRSGGPRSFYTVRHSNREDRAHRRMQGRLTLLAICAAVILLAISGLILFICDLANGAFRPSGESKDPAVGELTFQTVTLTADQIRTGELIVVNSDHVYAFPPVRLEAMTADAKQAYLLNSYRQKPDGVNYPYLINLSKEQILLPAAATALNSMLTQYYTVAGDSQIAVFDTYRSEQQQSSYSVPAGYSEHHTGLIVSLKVLAAGNSYADLVESERPWLFQNCHLFGFIQRYPTNKTGLTGVSNYPECFRYVGVPHATYIEQNGLCLEEYVTLLKNNHSTTDGTNVKMLSVDTDGNGQANYGIYYVPAQTAGDLTAVPVPKDLSYTVSGDNIGGFIVTVTLN
ncbi:MAG: D-alanyl-D-alanine carboxypeptidase family protein [Ruminococcaceae bacterium]|nr:D-alanyl-D-alanine carboxypeptidase family protein [Oscillospiraceae bacterium]